MPRVGLSPQAVVDLALAVVDEGGPSGWAELGLSAVAHRAGVAVPSLYKHVDGLPALRSAVAARCVCQVRAFSAGIGASAGRSYELLGEYRDQLVRTADGWRIARRELRIHHEIGSRDVLSGSRAVKPGAHA